MKHLISPIGTIAIAGALLAVILTPACQSYRHLPPPETGSGSREPEPPAPPAQGPEASSPLVGRWMTMTWVGEVETMIEVTIRPDGTVLLRRTPQDTLIPFEAGGMVIDEGRRIRMDDGVTLEARMLQDHLVTTDPLNGLETVYKRL
jgi:hypothetical protein